MPSVKKLPYITVDQYLASEERGSNRHEYVDGRTFAMGGASKRHNTIALNISSALRSHLKGSRCRVYMADVKLRVETTNSFYYPDVMVSCDQEDDKATFTTEPVLLVEILSPGTATIDRREKVQAYRQIESLTQYLIVHQRKKHVEMHLRTEHGGWEILEFGTDSEPELLILTNCAAGTFKLSMAAIYESIDWPAPGDSIVREGAAPGIWQPAEHPGENLLESEPFDSLDW
ncbi:MAG TPA: Uma2 family endonuclease [Chroococcales cyanobacterium]